MNIGFWSCIILVIPFVIIGVLFAIFKEKATKFVSGFNSFSKEEQAMYDKAQISRDIRNQCFIWTVIMLTKELKQAEFDDFQKKLKEKKQEWKNRQEKDA